MKEQCVHERAMDRCCLECTPRRNPSYPASDYPNLALALEEIRRRRRAPKVQELVRRRAA